MTAVINLSEFKELRATSTLVLVDMHEFASAGAEQTASPDISEAIENCRAALHHARALDFQIAFSRRLKLPSTMWASPNYPRWIDGFEPRRSDMIFDRQLPSCYANNEFAQMVDRIGGVYVIAGLFGEGACLCTAIDAFHRDHHITFLSDASASRAHQDVPAEAMHKAVAGIMSLYAYVGGTQPWIHATSPRIGASR